MKKDKVPVTNKVPATDNPATVKVPATVNNEKIFSLKKPSAEKEQKEKTKGRDNVFQNAAKPKATRQRKRRRPQPTIQDTAIATTTAPLVDYPDMTAAATVIASISASTPTNETTDIPASDIAPEATSSTASTEVTLPLQSSTPETTESAMLAEKPEINELPVATDPALEANPAPSQEPKSSWFTSLKNKCNKISDTIGSSIKSALRFEKAHQVNDSVVDAYQSVGSTLITKLSSAKGLLAKRTTSEQSATTSNTTEQAVSPVPGSCCANDSNCPAPVLFTKNVPAAAATDKEGISTPDVAPTAAKTLSV